MIFDYSYIATLQWQLDRMDWQEGADGTLTPPTMADAHQALASLDDE